jgi:hypothetical protein
VAHDLFPKTGIHFSGSCVSIATIAAAVGWGELQWLR